MTEGNMTGRPYGGANERPDDAEQLPGERPLDDDAQATTDPEQSPRAAQGGGMTEGRPFEGGAPDPARP